MLPMHLRETRLNFQKNFVRRTGDTMEGENVLVCIEVSDGMKVLSSEYID